jgi:hypothetical protein
MLTERERGLIDAIADELQPYKVGRRFPMASFRERCQEMAEHYRNQIRGSSEFFSKTTGPLVRDRLLDVARKSKVLAAALREAPKFVLAAPVIFETDVERRRLLAGLERIATSAELAARYVPIAKAKSVRQKFICAVYAAFLMREFSTRKLSITPDVGFLEISSLLYELFTKIHDKRFDSVCRRIVRPSVASSKVVKTDLNFLSRFFETGLNF